MLKLVVRNEEVRLTSWNPPAVVIDAAFSAPPGARLEAWVSPDESGDASSGAGGFRIKIHGCKRSAEGRYSLHGVAIDLRREQRAVLDSWTSSSGGPAT